MIDDAMTDAEWRAQIERRIACPIEWCSGRWLQHGGEGQSPDQWIHEDDDGIALVHGAKLHRDQEGVGPVTWALYIECDGTTSTVLAATALGNLADVLSDLSGAIRRIATTS